MNMKTRIKGFVARGRSGNCASAIKGSTAVVIGAVLVLLASFVLAEAVWSSDAQGLSPKLTAASETVFNWRKDRCQDGDIPDAALHAFKRADGQIVGFASHDDSRRFFISSDAHFRRDCKIVLSGAKLAYPSAYDDRIWIAATWTSDGERIDGLGHNEYVGSEHGNCRFKTYGECWYNSVVPILSKDGGATFSKIAAPPIANASFKFEAHEGQPRGFFDPTNIVFSNGFYYTIIYTTGGEEQPRGNCLFRTSSLRDYSLWEYWTGAAYVSSSYDAYGIAPPPTKPCEPLAGLDGRIWTVVRHQQSGLYIAAMAEQGPGQETGGIGLVYSTDLLSWFGYAKLMDASLIWGTSCNDPVRYGYPSLLDLNSADRNFSDVGNDPYIYVTELPVSNCMTTLNRNLIRYHVHLTVPTVAPKN